MSGAGRAAGVAERLRVHLLGPFEVARGGRPLTAQEVASRKGRLLLQVLAAQRGASVPADRLAEIIWPQRRPAKVDANLAVLVSRLRRLLGADVIRATATGWRFVPDGGVEVDLDVAGRLVTEARARLAAGAAATALAAATAAVALVERGSVLAELPDAEWMAPARIDAERVAGSAYRTGWEAALACGDVEAALRCAAAATARDPLDEAAHRALMRAHLAAGRPAAALAAYDRLRTLLAEQLGVDPADSTRRLHLAALRGEPPPTEPGAPQHAAAVREPLVGRAAELDQLGRAWDHAAGGSAGLFLLVGEAGTGKTSLARHLTARAAAAGGLVLQARSFEAERSLFIQPWIELVREAARAMPPVALAEAAEGHLPVLAELVPDAGLAPAAPRVTRADPELERRRAFEAVTALVRGLATRQPVLVFLDDLHLAGSSTLELLHLAARRLAGTRVLLVATVRVEEGDEARRSVADMAQEIDVGTLDETAVSELATLHGLGDLAEEIHRRARGHPLLTVELLRAAQDDVGPALPASLTDVVLARVRRAGPPVERLLRAASVVGPAFTVDEVAALVGMDAAEVAELAEQALATRLVVEAGAGYEFANDLLREVLYDTTPRPTRVVRHRRLARLASSTPEAVGHHAAAAGDWADAARAWVEAAARAAARWANRDAVRLLDDAVAAAERIDAADLRAAALLRRGKARAALGEYTAALADLADVRTAAEELGDGRLAAEALEHRGWTAYYARDMLAASDLAAQARGLAEQAAVAPYAGRGAQLLVSRLRHADGDLDAAEAALSRALDVPGGPDLTAQGGPHRALLLTHRDRYAEARQAVDRAASACRRAGAFRGLLTVSVTGVVSAGNEGDFAASLDWLAQMRELLRHTEDPQHRARAATLAAWVWHELGVPERARDLAAEALDLTAGSHSHPHVHALLAAADIALTTVDESAAADLLDRADEELRRPFAYAWRARLRHLALRARLEPVGGPAAEHLLATARTAGSPKYVALALSRLGRAEEAAAAAAVTGSRYLAAEVAPGPVAAAARDAIVAALPPDLRGNFLRRGRLARLRS